MTGKEDLEEIIHQNGIFLEYIVGGKRNFKLGVSDFGFVQLSWTKNVLF